MDSESCTSNSMRKKRLTKISLAVRPLAETPKVSPSESPRRGTRHDTLSASGSQLGQDDDVNSIAMSDAESTMTTESFFEVLGKKINRPRSPKGHTAQEPTPQLREERILAHAMKGSLNGIDGSVPEVEIIREPSWLIALRRKRNERNSGRSQHTIDREELGIVPIVEVPDELHVDDVLSLMSKFHCVSGESRDVDDDGVSSHGSDEVVAAPSPRHDVSTSGDVQIGRFFFRRSRKMTSCYEAIVKPWIIDYLFAKESIDPHLAPDASKSECDIFSPDRSFFANSTANFHGSDSTPMAVSHGLTTSIGADGQSLHGSPPQGEQMAEKDVLMMMM